MRCPGSRILNLIADSGQGGQVILLVINIFDAEVDIDDRLRRDPRYRGRVDMVDTYRLGPERADDRRALYREPLRPSESKRHSAIALKIAGALAGTASCTR